MDNIKRVKLIGGISALIAMSYRLIKLKRKHKISYLNKIKEQCGINLIEELPKTTIQKIIMLNYTTPSPFISNYTKYSPSELYSLTGTKEGINEVLYSISQLYKRSLLFPQHIDITKDSNLLINSYGNIKLVSSNQLLEFIATENKIPFFEKLNIISSVDKLLRLNTYDNVLLYNSTKDQIDYSSKLFTLFHSLYQVYSRFNLFFYVKIPKYPIDILSHLEDNHIYFIRRKRENRERCPNGKLITIDNEEFFVIDLGSDSNISEDEICSFMQNQLIQKCLFYYYLNSKIRNKQAIEGLNDYFKHEPYIAIFCNLKDKEHKEGLRAIISELKINYSKLPNNTSLIVIDDDSNESIKMIQVFKDKYFDLKKHSLSNTTFDSQDIEHYSPVVLKKLFIDINSLKSHQWKKDIDFEDNSYFVSH